LPIIASSIEVRVTYDWLPDRDVQSRPVQ
jgi:hypothetical protein